MLDRIISLLVEGVSESDILEICAKSGVEDPNKCLSQARKKLTIAASYNRDEQLGISIKRVNDIFESSMKEGDVKTALAAQKEISKLMDLYKAVSGIVKDSIDSNELQAVRDHLLPLEMTNQEKPISEHARLAALEITRGT